MLSFNISFNVNFEQNVMANRAATDAFQTQYNNPVTNILYRQGKGVEVERKRVRKPCLRT